MAVRGTYPVRASRKLGEGKKPMGIDKTSIYAIDKIVLVVSIAILRRR